MKTDRLFGITMYLLNHGKTSATKLAEIFEVSVRTIQRDIDSLCAAGIPIASAYGADGGYEILDSFGIDKQISTQKDYNYILTALNGLISAYSNSNVASLKERLSAISDDFNSDIVLDFGVLKENTAINKNMKLIQKAIATNHTMRFNYTNGDNIEKSCETEPVATIYKWYSWYMIGFCLKYDDYRLYKLVRMGDLQITHSSSTRVHNTWNVISKLESQKDTRNYWDIKLYCKKEIKVKCLEYLNGKVIKTLDNGDIIMQLHVPDNEHFWYGTILSFGDKAEVLEPYELKLRIFETGKKLIDLYKDV